MHLLLLRVHASHACSAPDLLNCTLGCVQRHVNIKVEAQDVNGERIQRTYTDWTARIFQHEYDHLQV